MAMPAKDVIQANKKLNAAGLLADDSKALPQRQASADEEAILKAIVNLSNSDVSDAELQRTFSPQTVFTLSTGSVAVGVKSVRAKLEKTPLALATAVEHRVLVAPASLPERTLCLDQVLTLADGSKERNLVVIKRRNVDGIVVSMTQERDHCRTHASGSARGSASTSSATTHASSTTTSATAAAMRGLNYYSPTDNMLSPCTSKLNLAKKKHHLKGTPRTLFASQLANKQPSTAAGRLTDMDMD